MGVSWFVHPAVIIGGILTVVPLIVWGVWKIEREINKLKKEEENAG